MSAPNAPDAHLASADDPVVDSAPIVEKKPLWITTTLQQKVADFLFVMLAYAVVGVSPGKIAELQTNDPKELIEDKTDKVIKNIGSPKVPILVEDTWVSFLNQDGTSTNYPGFDITRVVKLFCLFTLAMMKGYTRAAYCCSAMLVMPDGTRYYFTATRYVTICEKRKGPGAIDPYAIPDGSDKAFSEMSEEERTVFHPRAELARLIVAKLQELGY